MISKEHKKHSHITKPSYGSFSRNEWAILGANDSFIEDLATTTIKELSPFYKCAYLGSLYLDKFRGTSTNDSIEVYSKDRSQLLFSYNKIFNRLDFRQMFAHADLVMVNGNYHQAKAQVIVIDTNSKELLLEKLSLLTNVQLILLEDDKAGIFDFIKQAIPHWQEVPVYHIHNTHKITAFFEAQLKKAIPVLKGLVLAGGKSVRMGSDKGSMTWHGKEQRYHMADLLKECCDEVFISCRQDQQDVIDDNYKTIEDSFIALGPYGAILSAFREQPDCAWLVTACDMPLLDSDTLRYLTEHRNPSAMATTFESPHGGFPEPLITIWEPKSYPALLSMLSQGYTCPKKALENNEVCMLKPPNPDELMNVNTPEEKEKARHILQLKKQGNSY